MSDTLKYYKLASVVDNFLIENDLPNGWFNKCLVWAIRGYREISLDTFGPIKTDLFEVTDRNTVVMHANFVDWVVVYPGNDRSTPLGVNNDISSLQRTGNETSSRWGDIGYYLQNFRNGAIFSYGTGVSSKGRFRVHDNGTCKELLMDLDGPRHNQVYVEWISDGLDPCGETVIHPYIYDYLIKYMDLKYEEKNNPKATESSIYRKGQDVFDAERRLRARTNNLDPQTLLNLTRQYSTLALKV